MLAKSSGVCEYALIESVSLISNKLTEKLIGPVLDIKKGLYHGEYSLNMPEYYVEELKELIR